MAESIQVQDTLELTTGKPDMFKKLPREMNFHLVLYDMKLL